MHWAGALSDLGARFIYTRHEHAAVAAATAYARNSGKVGFATVTCGPGLTQVMTILPSPCGRACHWSYSQAKRRCIKNGTTK